MFSWLWPGGTRKKALAQKWTTEERELLLQWVPMLKVLPSPLFERALKVTRVMLAERSWQAPRDESLTPMQRMMVAAQAAVLVIGNEDYYFDRVTSVVIHRHTFRRAHWRGGKGMLKGAVRLDGEAHQFGAIVLAWPGVWKGAEDPSDGWNVVFHEFAHHLDGLDGDMGGVPPMPTASERKHFESVITSAYEAFGEQLDSYAEPLLDEYAAESMAEFFAVSSENFFERPRELYNWNEELYHILAGFYRLDPAEWNWNELV